MPCRGMAFVEIYSSYHLESCATAPHWYKCIRGPRILNAMLQRGIHRPQHRIQRSSYSYMLLCTTTLMYLQLIIALSFILYALATVAAHSIHQSPFCILLPIPPILQISPLYQCPLQHAHRTSILILPSYPSHPPSHRLSPISYALASLALI